MKNDKDYVQDMVSVIMPAYNSAGYISDAVESVVRQTYGNWELIIWDDMSEDATFSLAEGLASEEPRIRVFRGEQNAGVAAARNNAIGQASGRYLAFLDSDDMWMPKKLEKQISSMNETGCALSYSSYGFMNEAGEPIIGRTAPVKDEADYNSLLKDNYTGTLTIVLDRELTGDVRFPAKRHEDLILWLSIAKKGLEMKGLDEVLAIYRVSETSLSGNKLRAASWRWKVYRESEGLGLFRSLYYMAFYIYNSIKKRI